MYLRLLLRMFRHYNGMKTHNISLILVYLRLKSRALTGHELLHNMFRFDRENII